MGKQGEFYDSNLSRRSFLRAMGYTGMGFGLAGANLACSDGKLKDIKFFGTGTLDIGKQKWQKLEQDLGLRMIFEDNGNDPGPVIGNMIRGTTALDYDIGGMQGGIERELANAGKILPWDLDKIPNWGNTWDWIKDISHCKVDGKQYGLPVVINADSIIYLPEKIGGKVDSYEVIFDPKFKGRTSMEDAWINSVIFAAIFLKENSIEKIDNPGDLNESELGVVMEFLIKKKSEGQFKTFWKTWEDGLQLIRSGEVYAMTGWEPIVYAAQKEGIKAEYAVPREGFEGWSNDLIIYIGAERRKLLEDIHAFANWELGGYYGCELAKQRGYFVPNGKAIEYATSHSKEYDANVQREQYNHVKAKFLNNKGLVHWQNTRPKEFKLYEQWWSKLRVAKSGRS